MIRAYVCACAAILFAALCLAGTARADEDPCFSLGYNLDLAASSLHDAEAYNGEGNADLTSISKDNFNHFLDVADTYVGPCPYEEPIARYAIRRGLLIFDAAEAGFFSDYNAAEEGAADLGVAVCNHGSKYNPDGLAELAHRTAAADRRQKIAFSMPHGCN